MRLGIATLLGAVLMGTGLVSASQCNDDINQCTQDLRNVMQNENLFWFGSQYRKDCPLAIGNSFANPSCFNPDTAGKSILTRLWNATSGARLTEAETANKNLQLALVTFTAPDGQYEGCGHTYTSPATVHHLDPTRVARVNSWVLDKTPAIQWDLPPGADESTLYTVVAWDVGFFFLHGLYVNVRRSDISSGVALDKYHGPKTARFTPNVFLFAVFQQNGYIDPGKAGQTMGAVMGANQGGLPVSQFLTLVGSSVSELVAANVMITVADAYSLEFQRNNNILDNCPYLISQSPALKSIFAGAKIDVQWTPANSTLNPDEKPYLSSLIVNMDVEYSWDYLVVDSCCVKTTYQPSTFRLDPLGWEVAAAAMTRNTPNVKMSPVMIMSQQFDSIKDKVFTLILADMSETITKNNPNIIIHWLVTDITSADVSTGKEILPYMGPNPMDPKSPNTYVFLLLEQTTPTVDTSNLKDIVSNSCPDVINMRCGADLSEMMQAWQLRSVAGVTWMTVKQDPFARKRAYDEFKVRLMIDMCNGQPGFEDPCPSEQYNGATRLGNAAFAALVCFFLCLFSVKCA